MKVKIEKIIMPAFSAAVQTIFNSNLPIAASYKLHTLMEKVAEEQKRVETFRQKLLQEYVEKDEKGKLVQDENKMYKFKSEKDQEDCDTKFKELTSVEMDLEPLTLDELGPIQIKPATLSPLIGVLVVPKEEKKPKLPLPIGPHAVKA